MKPFSRGVWYFSLLWVTTVLSAGSRPAVGQDGSDNAAIRDFNAAAALQNSGLYSRATDKWKAFLQKYPGDSRLDRVHYYLGTCKLHTKKFPEAVQSFQTVLSKYPNYTRADGAQYNLAMARYQIALGSKRPEDFNTAAGAFGTAATKYANSKYAARALFFQGESLYSAGDSQGAAGAYKKLVDTHRNSPLLAEAYYALGTTQQELGQSAEAAATFQAFLSNAAFADHELADQIRLRRAMVLLDRQQHEEAEKLFAAVAAVKDFPNADYALLGQGQCRMATGKRAEAAAVFADLIKRFSTSEYKPAAQLAAGKCYFLTDKYADAQGMFQGLAGDGKQESPEAAYWLGRTLLELNKPQDAVTMLDGAIGKFPGSDFLPSLVLVRIDALYDLPDRRKETPALYAGFVKQHSTHDQLPRALYMAGLASLGTEDYAAAQQHAEAFLANAKLADHDLLPGVLYIAGESHLLAAQQGGGGDANKAEAYFRRLVGDHAGHGRVPRANLRIGWCLHKAEKYPDAVTHLTAALASLKDPAQLAEAQLLIGRSQSAAGKDREAVAAYDAALKAKPDWSRGDEVLLAAAASLRAVDDLDLAVQRLESLVSGHAQSKLLARALYQLGEIRYRQQKYDDAVKRYAEVVQKFAGTEWAGPSQYGLAAAHFAKNDYNNTLAPLDALIAGGGDPELIARGLYLRGLVHQRLKQLDPAAKDLAAFLAGKPEGDEAIDARYALLMCQIGLKQFEAAATGLEALLVDKADYVHADKAYYELAHAQLAQQKPDEAAKAFAALAEKFPQSPLAAESWFHVGRTWEKGQDAAKAAAAYAAGLAKAKQAKLREKLQYKLGDVQFQLQKYAEAATTLQAQVDEHPDGELAGPGRFLLAESCFRQNKFDQALPLFVRVATDKVEKYHALALYQAGRCATNLKNWTESENSFRALVEQFPEYPQVSEARYGLGWAQQNQKKFKEAEQTYEQVTRETEAAAAAKARFMIGEIAFAQGRYEDAIEHFFTVATGYPYKEMQVKAQYESGRCFIELKQNDKALAALQVVVKKFPDTSEAQHAARLIGELK